MDIKQLQHFVSVYQSQNFTQTAKEFFVTQPALSRSISALEEELGVKLFLRSPHYVKPTPEGCAYYQHALSILKTVKAGSDKLRTLSTSRDETLRVSVLPSLQEPAVSMLSLFHESYPDIQVIIDVSTGLEQLLAINESRFDIYFSYSSLLENNSSFTSYKLSSEQLCLFLPEKYLKEYNPNDFSFLSGKKFVIEKRFNGPYIAGMLQNVCASRGVDWGDNIIALSNLASVCMAVSTGVGYTVNPMSICKSYYMGNVVTIPIVGNDATINYVLGIPSARQSIAINAFKKIAETRFAKT